MALKTFVTCCLLLAACVGEGHAGTSRWDAMDTQTHNVEKDVFQFFKSTLAEFESELRQLLMAMSQIRVPYVKTREALEKYSDIMDYLQVSNPRGPIFSFKKAAEGFPYAMKGYKHEVYAIKYALYQTVKVLADFESMDELKQLSFDEASKLKKTMTGFKKDFQTFFKAQFTVSEPVKNVKEAMNNLTKVCRDVDSAPEQLYETLFSLRETSKRFGDALATFYEKYSDLWERLYDVQVALSKCDQVQAMSNGTNSLATNENKAEDLFNDFMNMLMNFGVDETSPPKRDTDSQKEKQQKANEEALFKEFADFLRWMEGDKWDEMFSA